MPDAADISSQFVATLATVEPQLDTSIGTPIRKILDVVAEQIAMAYTDQFLANYTFDINSKSGSDLDDFCLPSGVQIVTESGLRAIEEVQVGDLVQTHTGKFFPVRAISVRGVDEPIVWMRTWGQQLGVRMTGNHPVLATRLDTLTETTRDIYRMRYQSHGTRTAEAERLAERSVRLRGTGTRRSFLTDSVRREWVRAEDLRPGDIVWSPTTHPGGGHRLSDDLKSLYGWFISEGSARLPEGAIKFTLNDNEVEYRAEIIRLIEQEWGLTPSEYWPSPKAVQITCYSKSLATSLKAQFGEGAGQKRIDWDLFHSDEDLTPLLISMWKGDGSSNHRQTSTSYATSSWMLAYQVKELLLRMGLNPTWDTQTVEQQNSKGRMINDRQIISRYDAHAIRLRGRSAEYIAELIGESVKPLERAEYAGPCIHHDGYVGYAILDHRLDDYEGLVHNIDVDVDNSYVLPGSMAVHNCLMFGFTRFQAQRAVGVVTFARTTAATTDYQIPSGSQVATVTGAQVFFATTVPAVLAAGQTSVDIPVQAVVGGTSGNLAANTLTSLASSVSGVMSVTNAAPLTNGTDAETDAVLIARFKATVFRGLAGTEDMFLAVALESSAGQTAISQPVVNAPTDTTDLPVTQANVLGSSQRWREQVQVLSGAATSTIPAANANYIYPGTQIFGPDIDNGSILVPGMTYSFDSTVIPPVVHSLAGGLVDNNLYDLDFEYSSTASRNDPANGIANRVDIWVNGSRNVEASETTFLRTARAFNATTGNALNIANFVRLNTTTAPSLGNYFVQLGFGPIVSFPDTLTVGGTTYIQGTDFWVVHNRTAFGYAPTSMFGLEWLSSHAPADASTIVLDSASSYIYNAVPADVQARIAQWRLVTSDVQVHQAVKRYFRLGFVIMYASGYDQTTVNTAVTSALANFMASKGFDAPLQVSDITQAAHNVAGVDNIRLSRSNELFTLPDSSTTYGIDEVGATGDHIAFQQSGGRPIDLQFGDNQVPLLYDCTFLPKAANSFSGS
jgi:hypothetical protein